MLRSRLKVIISACMVLCLMVLAGCQPLGGVDFNKVFTNSLKVKSSLSSSSMQFKLDLDEKEFAKLDEESQAAIKVLSDISLTFDDIKMQDMNHLSMKGKLALSDQASLDFSMQMTDEILVVWLEGAKQPFSFDLTGKTSEELMYQVLMDEYGYTLEDIASFKESYEEVSLPNQQKMIEAFQEVTNNVASYLIEKLPNAEKVNVDFGSSKVADVDGNLFHVQAELNGKDFYSLLDQLLTALLQDRKGIEKLVGQVMELVNNSPELQALLQPLYGYESDDDDWYLDYDGLDDWYEEADAADAAIESNKAELQAESADKAELQAESTEAVELTESKPADGAEEATEVDVNQLIAEEIMTMLQALSDELKTFKKDKDTKEMFDAIFGDALKVKLDMHIDQQLQIRKSIFDISYTFNEEMKKELEIPVLNGFSLVVSNMMNNINEPVVADKPKVTADTVSMERMVYLEDYETLQYFEEDSLIYNMIREYGDMSQSYWKFDDEEYNPLVMYGSSITAVPLREVMEAFNGKVEYSGATKTIIATDKVLGNVIELKVGSKEAKVNGKTVALPVPVEVIDGVTYMPARALAEALGAEIYWEDFDGAKCLNIERWLY